MIPWAKFEGKEAIYTDWVYNITPSILRYNVDPLSTIKKYAEMHMMYNTTERRYAVSQFDHPASYDFKGQHVAELTTCMRNLTNYIEKHEPLFPSPTLKPIDTCEEDHLLGMGSLTTPTTLDDLPEFSLDASSSPTLPTRRRRTFSPTAIPISSILNYSTPTAPLPLLSTAEAQPSLIQVSPSWDTTSTDGSNEIDPGVIEYNRAYQLARLSQKSEHCLRAFRRIKMRRGSRTGSGMKGSALLRGKGKDVEQAGPGIAEVARDYEGERRGQEGMFEDKGEKCKEQVDVGNFVADESKNGLAVIHTLNQALNTNRKRDREWQGDSGGEESQTLWMKRMKKEVVSARAEGIRRQMEATQGRGFGSDGSMPLATGREQWHGKGRGQEEARLMWPQR